MSSLHSVPSLVKIKFELCVCCRALLPVSIPAPISPLRAPLMEYDKSLSMLTPAAMAGAERCEQTLRVKARKRWWWGGASYKQKLWLCWQTVTWCIRKWDMRRSVSGVAWQGNPGERGKWAKWTTMSGAQVSGVSGVTTAPLGVSGRGRGTTVEAKIQHSKCWVANLRTDFSSIQAGQTGHGIITFIITPN